MSAFVRGQVHIVTGGYEAQNISSALSAVVYGRESSRALPLRSGAVQDEKIWRRAHRHRRGTTDIAIGRGASFYVGLAVGGINHIGHAVACGRR